MNIEQLTQSLQELSRRPGHEGVRVRLYQILTDRLGANSADIRLEQQVPEVRGRIDALVGRTVVEIKSDLRREMADAEAQLSRYLPEREAATGHSYVGLATDGADFVAYEYRDGALRELTRRRNKPSEALDTAVWMESVFAVRDRLPADALSIIENLGKDSAAFARASSRLRQAWDAVGTHPEPQLKRQLWEQHLALVYGTDKTSNALWLRHTYLVCVAKAIAAAAMGLPITDPADLLSGQSFRTAGIMGAVESDFFDWILHAPHGPETVRRITDHAARFDLAAIDVDLLKVLYESLIDPEDRHDLGEYYTPDWLADLVTGRALGDDMDARVLDPSCGSGTFLFHAIRRKRQAMEAAGVPASEIAARCTRTVHGSTFTRSP
jgi:type I restriction-modification system DNA methylase subunit